MRNPCTVWRFPYEIPGLFPAVEYVEGDAGMVAVTIHRVERPVAKSGAKQFRCKAAADCIEEALFVLGHSVRARYR